MRSEVKLGSTKMDIEGVGRRRCFLCICPQDGSGDLVCPACALARLRPKEPSEEDGGDGKLVLGPGGMEVSHLGLCRAWRRMLADVPRFDDTGKQVDAEITEHTARRTGAQFHARRGLALWQIQYIGRWGGPTVEIYVGEAFAEIRAGWADAGASRAGAKRARQNEKEDLQLWEVMEQLRRLSSVVADVRSFQEELGKCKLAGGAHTSALCDEAVAKDIAEEALNEGTFVVSPESIEKFSKGQTSFCVVNCRSCVLHAVDLCSVATSASSSWTTSCGWNFGPEDALLHVGRLAEARCTRAACAARFAVMDLMAFDEEEDVDVGEQE